MRRSTEGRKGGTKGEMESKYFVYRDRDKKEMSVEFPQRFRAENVMKNLEYTYKGEKFSVAEKNYLSGILVNINYDIPQIKRKEL